jgi:capsid protein
VGVVPESATDDVEWTTPRWDYVNPHQDIKAEVEAIGACLLTPSESLRQRGYDPAKVFAEAGRDFAAMRASGALELMSFMSGKPAPSAASAGTQE